MEEKELWKAAGSRLATARVRAGFPTQKAFAQAVSLSTPTVAKYEQGVREIPLALLHWLSEQRGINANWIITGEGDVLDDPSKLPSAPITVDPADFQQLIDNVGSMSQNIGAMAQRLEPPPPPPTTITFIPLQASAGGGSVVYEEPEEIQMDMDMLSADLLGIAPKHIRLFRIRGESMYPTLNNGDVVVVDRSKPGRGKYPEGDKLYVVSVAGELFAKRAEWLSGNVLSWISDNPQFPPIVVGADQVNTVKLIGQVVWTWHKVK